jgi:hypothetical protein
MRRLCIAAILAGTFSGSALPQTLRPAYAPDGASQSTQSVPLKRAVHARKVSNDRAKAGAIALGSRAAKRQCGGGTKLRRVGCCPGVAKSWPA